MRSITKYLLGTILCFSVVGCSNTSNIIESDHLVEVAAPLEINIDRWFHPITNSNDPYPSVCSLHLFDGSLIGSGILIRPDVVLTAGHCIDKDNIYSVNIGDESIAVKSTVLHPRHSNFGRLRNDLGLIFLECDSKYEPARLGCVEWMNRYDDITTVGYSHGYKKFSKKDVFRYFGTMVSEPNYMKFLPRPMPIWFGDSGGGVFAEFMGRTYVVGIISHFRMVRVFEDEMVITECSAVNIAKYLDWISEEIKNEKVVE
jgi:hypothetical protein